MYITRNRLIYDWIFNSSQHILGNNGFHIRALRMVQMAHMPRGDAFNNSAHVYLVL